MVSKTIRLLCILPIALGACETMNSKGHTEATKHRLEPSTRSVSRYDSSPVVQQTPAPAATSHASDNTRLRQKLKTKTLTGIDFANRDGGDLQSAVRLIQTITNIPIILTPGARHVISDEGVTFKVELTAPLRVDHLLNLMVDGSDSLSWTVKYGVVQIRSKTESSGTAKLKIYDVRDLLVARTQFIAPTIRGIPTGDDDSLRTGGEGEERTQAFEADSLVANLKSATDPEYWDSEGGGSIEATESGYLIVKASPEMHAKLGGALGR